MSKGRIFVTGGNGFIGSRLVHALLENDYEVRCLLRSTSKTDRINGLNYEKFIGDITDQDSLEKGMEGCSGVMHLAGLSNWDDIHSPMMEAVVVEGSKNVVKAAKKANLKMVYVSSSTAIDGTETPDILDENSDFTLNKKTYSYAFAKKRVEAFCIDAACFTFNPHMLCFRQKPFEVTTNSIFIRTTQLHEYNRSIELQRARSVD